MAIIYICTNIITNKVYIGCSIRPLVERSKEHIKELTAGTKGGLWQTEFDILGASAFKFEVLANTEEVLSLPSLEIDFIKQYNSLEPSGYNKKIGSVGRYSDMDKAEASEHSVESLGSALRDGVFTNMSIGDIANKYNLSRTVIEDLLNCKAYRWVEYFYPEEYSTLKSIRSSGIRRSSLFLLPNLKLALELYTNTSKTAIEISSIAGLRINQFRDLVRGKAYTWLLKILPDIYRLATDKYKNAQKARIHSPVTLINNNTNEKYELVSLSDAAKELNIDHRRLGEILSGNRSEYKGWTLV